MSGEGAHQEDSAFPYLEGEDEYEDPVDEEPQRGYRCRACGAIFSSRKELELHWNKMHASWKRKRRKK